MLNHIVIMGRLVRDPELRRTQTGTPVTSMRIACDRDFKSENGERATDFIDVVCWRNTAEFAAKYYAKGRMVVVSGRLQMREWTDKEGGKRVSAEVVADNLYFADSRRDGDNQSGGYQQNNYQQGGYQQNSYPQQSGSFQQGAYQQPSYQQPRPQQSSYPQQSGGFQQGGYPQQSSYAGYDSPVSGSDFQELGDDDGDLPF